MWIATFFSFEKIVIQVTLFLLLSSSQSCWNLSSLGVNNGELDAAASAQKCLQPPWRPRTLKFSKSIFGRLLRTQSLEFMHDYIRTKMGKSASNASIPEEAASEAVAAVLQEVVVDNDDVGFNTDNVRHIGQIWRDRARKPSLRRYSVQFDN
jgi:hypothetical protein